MGLKEWEILYTLLNNGAIPYRINFATCYTDLNSIVVEGMKHRHRVMLTYSRHHLSRMYESYIRISAVTHQPCIVTL